MSSSQCSRSLRRASRRSVASEDPSEEPWSEESGGSSKKKRRKTNNCKTSASNSALVIQKPRYVSELLMKQEQERSATPSSRSSSPGSATRRSSRITRKRILASQSISVQQRKGHNNKRTKNNTSTSRKGTPVSSRASSVTSNSSRSAKRGRSSYNGRGYNPAFVKESDYHYGSDFENDDEEDDFHQLDNEQDDDDSNDSDASSITHNQDDELDVDDDLKVESDVDLECTSTLDDDKNDPFWLRDDESNSIPDLVLPRTSEDLLVSSKHVLSVISVYEVLRRCSQLLRLTPFRVEDFCAALAAEDQSNLLSEIHMAILKALVRYEDSLGVTFGPVELKDSSNCVLFFMDAMTWPESLRAFIQSDSTAANSSLSSVLQLMEDHLEYPFVENNDEVVGVRLQVLAFLTDQLLQTSSVRDFLMGDGNLNLNEEHCRICHRLGEMLVCDSCSGVYHLGCLDPPLSSIPDEEWQCYNCQYNHVEGVSDCNSLVPNGNVNNCRLDTLGTDRMGNRYWFVCRRLVVEKRDDTVAYYSTVKQLEELSEVLDDDVYEKELWEEMEKVRVEMERQMGVTESLTEQRKLARKSYLELENAAIEKIQKEREEREKREKEASEASTAKSYCEKETKVSSENKEMSSNEEQSKVVPDVKDEECDIGPSSTDGKEGERELGNSEVPSVNGIVEGVSTIEANTSTTDGSSLDGGELRMTRRTAQELSSGTLYFKLGQENSYLKYVNYYSLHSSALSKGQAVEERSRRQHFSHKFSLTDVSALKWIGNLHSHRSVLISTLKQTILQLEASLPTLFMHPNWTLLRKPWAMAVNKGTSIIDMTRALVVLQCCIRPAVLLPVWTESLGHTRLRKTVPQQKDDRKRIEKRERKEKEDEEERLRPFTNFVKYTLGLKHQVSKQKGEEYRIHGQNGWLWMRSTRVFKPSDASKLGLRAGPARLAIRYTDVRDSKSRVVLMEPKAFAYFAKKQKEMVNEQKTLIKDEDQKEDSEPGNSEGQYMIEERNEQNREEEKEIGNDHKSEINEHEGTLKDLVELEKNKKEALRLSANDTAIKEEENANVPSTSDVNGANATNTSESVKACLSLNEESEKGEGDDKSSTDALKHANIANALKNARLEEQTVDEELTRPCVNVSESLSHQTRSMYPKVAAKARILDDMLSRRLQLKALEERRIAQKVKASGNFLPVKLEKEEIKVESPNESTSAQKSNNHTDKTFLREAKVSIEMQIDKLNAKKSEHVRGCYSLSTLGEKCFRCYCQNCLKQRLAIESAVAEASVIEEELLKKAKLRGLIDSNNGQGSDDSEVKVTRDLEVLSSRLKALLAKILHAELSSEYETSNSDPSQNKELAQKMEEEEALLKRLGLIRHFSSSDTKSKIYLQQIESTSESRRQSKVVKYPFPPSFYSRFGKRQNILYLAKHDAKRMARNAGTLSSAEGFNYNNNKVNASVWPYPCPRPSFKTAWLYRCATLTSVQALALQLRILWASLRWDDMMMKPLSTEAKRQETTEDAIITTEILKQRHVGRFLEITEYLQRKVTIPLNVRRSVDLSSAQNSNRSRLGLRKRKRAESPQKSEPKFVEKWVNESSIELWEVRAYKERLERERNASLTRMKTGTAIKEPQRLDPSLGGDSRKEKSVLKDDKQGCNNVSKNGKSVSVMKKSNNNSNGKDSSIVTTTSSPAPTVRRVLNGEDSGNRYTIVGAPAGTMSPNSNVVKTDSASQRLINIASLHPSATKKIFVSKDGKIVGTQIVPRNPGALMAPSNYFSTSKIVPPVSGGSTNEGSKSPSVEPQQQKVQLIRSADGKIQVKGLLPGQRLIQTPDGKFQIQSMTTTTTTTTTTGTTTITAATTTSDSKNEPITPTSPLPADPSKARLLTGMKPSVSTLNAAEQETKVHGDPSTNSPSISTPLSANSVVTKANPSPMTSLASPSRQLVELRPLGANTVTIHGNQIIVSGPDVAEAKNIAQQLSSGQVKVGNFNGRQVLVSTKPAPQVQSPLKTEKTSVSTATALNPTPSPLIRPTLLSPQPTDETSMASVQPSSNTISSTTTPTTTSTTMPRGIQPHVRLEAQPGSSLGKVDISMAPKEVTAQLIQTPLGPRIILQGIQGSSLPREDLKIIQQQVKDELLKAQEKASREKLPPPTKIVFTLPEDIRERMVNKNVDSNHALVSSGGTVGTNPVEVVCNNAENPSTSYIQTTNLSSASPQPEIISKTNTTLTPTPTAQTTEGKSVSTSEATASDKQSVYTPVQTMTSASQQATETSVQGTSETVATPETATLPTAEDSSFKVTHAMIQEAISTALKTTKLTPQTEHKLKKAMQYHQRANQVPNEENFDNKPKANETPRLSQRSLASLERTRSNLVIKLNSSLTQKKEQLRREIGVKREKQEKTIRENVKQQVKARIEEAKRQEEHKKQNEQIYNRNSLLEGYHSDNEETRLKNDEKRGVKRKGRSDSLPKNDWDDASKDESKNANSDDHTRARKRRRRGCSEDEEVESKEELEDQLYCTCKTKYDPSKFYVGCDSCKNWFHGKCVGVTVKMSRKMSEYICDECRIAQEDKQTPYCLCRQPYDESQCYIACERCSDWFHCRCVGILQCEAEAIDVYFCPRCDPNTKLNRANFRRLEGDEKEMIKRVNRQILSNRSSALLKHSNNFRPPLSTDLNLQQSGGSNQTIDLNVVEGRVNSGDYDHLWRYVGDMISIFDTCRFFNATDAQLIGSVENVEQLLAQKLKGIRDKLGIDSYRD